MAHPGGISTAGHIYGSQKTGYFISVRKKSLISLEMPFYKTTELGSNTPKGSQQQTKCDIFACVQFEEDI